MDRLEQAFAKLDRREGKFAVLFMDLDNFKVINDSLGHEAGDQLLVKVAERVTSCLRPADTAARLGGDEFTILLEDIAGVSEVTQVAKRILEAMRIPFTSEGQKLHLTTSLGVALSGSSKDPGDLLRTADLAMYSAKAKGKNLYEIFEQDMDVRALERLWLERDLRRALERDEFRVYYQPLVSLESGKIVGREALARWEHPERGLLCPAEFMAVAQEAGLVVPLEQWVLREACRQAREWQVEHPSDPPLTMYVNLSPRHLQEVHLVQYLARTLQETGLEAHCLTLEITESATMEDIPSTIGTLEKLKDLGIKIAIDDFGTGYSSLSYLKRFPVDFLKIDRSFISELGKDPKGKGLVSAVISLAHTLGLKVVAEGVETEEQLVHLRELGCELAQGFYFGKSTPAM
jgi:diguanylate cyclase (GGDEF)-like protein